MESPLTIVERISFGIVLPMLVATAALLVIMRLPSSASAAEFAGLGVMLGAIIISPALVIINGILAWGRHSGKISCFLKGMLFPGLVILGALAYQLGLVDAFL